MTPFCMCTAAGILLTAADGPSARVVFAFLTGAQALFGFGCGGEFPVAAASASERAESDAKLRALRGQTTVLVFAMQARAGNPA
jgi:MFS family permease